MPRRKKTPHQTEDGVINNNTKSNNMNRKAPHIGKKIKESIPKIAEIATNNNNKKKTKKQEIILVPSKVADHTSVTEDISAKISTNKKKRKKGAVLKIAALGGLGEIGKNLYVYEYGDDLFIIDCGISFPDEDMPGVDLVIADFAYLERNASRFRGIIVTHGHEDHVGAIPFLLKKINVPVYATRLTLGYLEMKLVEHRLISSTVLNVVKPREKFKLGVFEIEFIKVNHSIPDACSISIKTPVGIVIHTGDFKIDYTPIGKEEVIDLPRFAELGRMGVLALLSESTNAERPGFTPTERSVGESFDRIFAQENVREKRIIIATFSTNIHRIQQVADAAGKAGRKLAVSGRSMENFIAKSRELGYLNIPPEIFITLENINRYPASEVVLVTTGSQGEPLSALQRMSCENHRNVKISKNDLVVISANPIPGNEKTVGKVINGLFALGADVIYENMYDVHVSGHACQEELKLMLNLTKPKFFIPIHGQLKQQIKHAALAKKMGIPESNIIICGNGDQIELDAESAGIARKIEWDKILIDGRGTGEIDNKVLSERQKLGDSGIIVVSVAFSRDMRCIVGDIQTTCLGVYDDGETLNLFSTTAYRIVNDALEKSTPLSRIHDRLKTELNSILWLKSKRGAKKDPPVVAVSLIEVD